MQVLLAPEAETKSRGLVLRDYNREDVLARVWLLVGIVRQKSLGYPLVRFLRALAEM